MNRNRPPAEHLIVLQLARIDLSIRRRWWRIYREDEPTGRTFTSCMKATEDFAEQLWLQDISVQMYPPNQQQWIPDRKRKRDWEAPWSPPKKGGKR